VGDRKRNGGKEGGYLGGRKYGFRVHCAGSGVRSAVRDRTSNPVLLLLGPVEELFINLHELSEGKANWKREVELKKKKGGGKKKISYGIKLSRC